MEIVDFAKIANIVNPDNRRISYEKNKHLFHKVAFDVFQLSGAPVESYWILEKGEDGKEYLVANYEDTDITSTAAQNNWEAESDKKAENVTIFYKNMPIKRLSSSEFGFNKDDVHIFKQALSHNLNNNKNFVKKLLNEFKEDVRQSLFKVFPELSE